MVCLDRLGDPAAHLNLEQMHPDTKIIGKLGQMAFRQLVPAQVFIVILFIFVTISDRLISQSHNY